MNQSPHIHWFRLDLRLSDNPALNAAIESGRPVLPVFIWDPRSEEGWQPGAASCWWLHQSLRSLDDQLRGKGSRLILRRGPTLRVLQQLIEGTGAVAVSWSRRYEPEMVDLESRVRQALESSGCSVESSCGNLVFEPWTVQTKSKTPFQVFTPFWKACCALQEPSKPIPSPRSVPSPDRWPNSMSIESLGMEPTIDWAAGMRKTWAPGEPGARSQLKRFLSNAAADYESGRDRPDGDGTSRLSAYLHFGEISAREVWHRVRAWTVDGKARVDSQAESYLRQLGWREFAHHVLFHFPRTPEQPLRKAFETFQWVEDSKALKAWQRGLTGYPLVDAGMRQLWATGWMHNRVRMLVASFLVKDLMISWNEGARWFWDTLVDADLANNTLGWQWSAGCGADAAPYFRVFNPITQGRKFDPDGAYVRKWVPELSKLPTRWIHQPWEAPEGELLGAGVILGRTYPFPIVDHAERRKLALQAFQWDRPILR